MKEITFELIKNHLVYTDGADKIIIDTGCEASFDLNNPMIPSTIKDCIHKFVDPAITKLLGSDFMAKYGQIYFDIRNKRVVFANRGESIQTPDIVAETKCTTNFRFMGFCINFITFDMEIGDATHKMIFDTGAIKSYLLQNIANKGKSAGQIEDFLPLISCDAFQTPAYTHSVCIGQDTFDINFGVAHTHTAGQLNTVHADGVIGYDLMSRYGVLIDFENDLIKFTR